MIVVIIVLVVAAIVAIVVGARVRRRSDPVDSFRRQIDALGPEARRPVVDQVRRVDEDPDQTGPDAS
ncbi:MAG: hypothetical protein AAFP84_21910 [Actinomycetota bacterium]